MKVVIAYDGSTYADAAIDDMIRTGLRRDSHVLMASVADFSDRKPTYSDLARCKMNFQKGRGRDGCKRK